VNCGWKIKKLGEICEIQLGKTPARANSSFWDREKETGNIWLSIADLLNVDGHRAIDSKEYLSNEGAKLCKRVKKGTLLVSFKLTLGRLAYAGRDLFTNEAIAALTINDECELSREYLFYFLQFFDWEKEARDDVKLKGMTLNKAKLKNIGVSIPSMAEQKRIVAILDEAFAGIETAIANTEKNLANSREIFDSRLDMSFSPKANRWQKKKLGEVYDVRDGTHDSPKYQETGKALITSKNLKDGSLDLSNVKYISEEDYNKICERSKVDKGDVLFAMIGTIGNPVVIEADPNYAIKNVALFKVPRGRSGVYLKYYLQSPFVIKKMKVEAKGTTQRFVGLGYLREFLIPMPNQDVERRTVRELKEFESQARNLREVYVQKLESLAELKQSLLQKAFSGELTADRAEREVESATA